jgi:hypothetical protein
VIEALLLGAAAAGLVFFPLLAVSMLPLGGWSVSPRCDVEPGVL